MIFDKIRNLEKYEAVCEGLAQASDFLKKIDINNFKTGVVKIDGDDIFASVQQYETEDKELLKFECHKKYIDVQCILEGEEDIYWENTEDLDGWSEFNYEGDYALSESKNLKYPISLKSGDFILLYPEDAHKPRCKNTASVLVKKVVIKIRQK